MGLFSSKSRSTSYTTVNNYTAGLDQSQASNSLGVVAQQSHIGGVYYAPVDLNVGSDALNLAGANDTFRIGKSGISGNPVAGTIKSIPAQTWMALVVVVAIIFIFSRR
jgi:hypothetical protein